YVKPAAADGAIRNINDTIERGIFTLNIMYRSEKSRLRLISSKRPSVLFPLAYDRWELLFRQNFLVCQFAWRDRVVGIHADVLPAACVDTDPPSFAQRLAFAGQ